MRVIPLLAATGGGALAGAVAVTAMIASADPPTLTVPTIDDGTRDGTLVGVDRVIDGDTFVLDDGATHVRLIGVDTPEVGDCGADQATKATEAFLLGPVTLIDAGQDTDRYGRLLRYVNVDGQDLGFILIQDGLADARYDSLDGYPRHPRQDAYRAADAATQDVCS